ncbi:MAG: hypothetical protein IPJ74_26695 [Saprospiraceae bacterium]|nr:hypothetical protein [Saprospiraceae bacterium]
MTLTNAKYEDLFVARFFEKKEEKKDSVKIVTPASINPEGLMTTIGAGEPLIWHAGAVYITQKAKNNGILLPTTMKGASIGGQT